MNKIFNFFNITGLERFLFLVSPKLKKKLIILFFFMFVVSLLEILSIGIIIPLINFVFNPNTNNNIINLQGFGSLNFFPNSDYISLVIIFTFLVYLII